MLLVDVQVSTADRFVERAVNVLGEEAMRDRVAWNVYEAVAACGEDPQVVSVSWAVRAAGPSVAVDLTAAGYQPANPAEFHRAVQMAVSDTLMHAWIDRLAELAAEEWE